MREAGVRSLITVRHGRHGPPLKWGCREYGAAPRAEQKCNSYVPASYLSSSSTDSLICTVPLEQYVERRNCCCRSRTSSASVLGECTESGLHGANRLASNSLLECFVFGEAAANDILARWSEFETVPPIRPWDASRVTESDEEVVIRQNWTEIRRFMWNYVGIVRTTKRLERARTASRCSTAKSATITATSA